MRRSGAWPSRTRNLEADASPSLLSGLLGVGCPPSLRPDVWSGARSSRPRRIKFRCLWNVDQPLQTWGEIPNGIRILPCRRKRRCRSCP
jgi:hypothetical protein